MAKALKTRQKLMFRTDGLRPCNPPAAAARRPAAAAPAASRAGPSRLARLRGAK